MPTLLKIGLNDYDEKMHLGVLTEYSYSSYYYYYIVIVISYFPQTQMFYCHYSAFNITLKIYFGIHLQSGPHSFTM